MLQGVYAPQNEQLQQLQSAIDRMTGQQFIPSVPQPRKIRYVQGFKEARQKQEELPPDSSEILADDTDDILYIITKDKDGKCPKKIMFTRLNVEYEPDEPRYVTQDDLAKFKADILEALKGDKA